MNLYAAYIDDMWQFDFYADDVRDALIKARLQDPNITDVSMISGSTS